MAVLLTNLVSIFFFFFFILFSFFFCFFSLEVPLAANNMILWHYTVFLFFLIAGDAFASCTRVDKEYNEPWVGEAVTQIRIIHII